MIEPLLPACSPSECASWLPPDKLVLRALAAYEMARLACVPESGGFMDGGEPYSNRETFISDLLDNFALLVGDHAREAGVPVPSTHDQDRLDLLIADGMRRSRRARS